ncbi:hypothetical protein M0R45_001497 [Rubus argutus]|uniref:Uncharacterized protein n=1 Tax=Rubus argutus TaxID=59490 RepID=A0AAW1VH60_RUBAR
MKKKSRNSQDGTVVAATRRPVLLFSRPRTHHRQSSPATTVLDPLSVAACTAKIVAVDPSRCLAQKPTASSVPRRL